MEFYICFECHVGRNETNITHCQTRYRKVEEFLFRNNHDSLFQFNCTEVMLNLGQYASRNVAPHEAPPCVIRDTAINNSRDAVLQSSPAGRHASHEPERNVNETHTGYG